MKNEINENPASCQNAVSGSTYKQKPIWTDYYLNNFKWYRKYRKLKWYKHQFTEDALELSITFTGTFWALYSNINRYSEVIETEGGFKALMRQLVFLVMIKSTKLVLNLGI